MENFKVDEYTHKVGWKNYKRKQKISNLLLLLSLVIMYITACMITYYMG